MTWAGVVAAAIVALCCGGRAAAAPSLPSSPHYTGTSIRQTVLSQAGYRLSKVLHVPTLVVVACWSDADWRQINGDNPESAYSTLGFWSPTMPHWVNLSPAICRAMETLLYHRPRYANAIEANAVDTLTHEMIHAIRQRKEEAKTECYAMQLSIVTAAELHLPLAYTQRLAHLTLGHYLDHPRGYVDRAACREDGAWDLFPGRNSPPWHYFAARP